MHTFGNLRTTEYTILKFGMRVLFSGRHMMDGVVFFVVQTEIGVPGTVY
jgi:hypothetical protein